MPKNTKAKKPKLQREKLYTLTARTVRQLVKDGNEDAVSNVLERLMWISNASERTGGDMAAAVIALAPLASDDELAGAAHEALWWREVDSWKASHHAAANTCRRILEPLGVRFAECGCMEPWVSDICCDKAKAIAAAAKAVAERQAVEAREARAISAARQAIDSVADDPEALRLVINMIPVYGARELKERAA